jgi:hypothetical protein
VGPMTVTMLMKNTIKAFVQQRSSMMKSWYDCVWRKIA